MNNVQVLCDAYISSDLITFNPAQKINKIFNPGLNLAGTDILVRVFGMNICSMKSMRKRFETTLNFYMEISTSLEKYNWMNLIPDMLEV